jgi:O-antigen ligase
MAIPLLIGLALGIFGSQSFSRLKKGLLSFMILLALATTLTAFVFAQSRGAWVSLGLALLLMNIILVRRKVLRSYSLIIFLFIMAGAFSYLYHSDSKVSERLGTMVDLSQAEASMTTRMDIWRGTLAMIKDKPLTGVGIGCFEWAFPKYRSETLGRAGIRPVYAHNDYLHMTAELGVFALPLIFWILLSLISRGISTIKLKDARGIKATFLLLSCGIGILSLSLHAFVDFNFHIPANMLTFVVLSGIILGASVSERK